MDAKKWLADTAKEAVGVNDFEKAKDAFDRATATSKGIDYSGGLGGDIKNVLGATPGYTKDIATGVKDTAVGAGKALVNVGMLVVPAGKARAAAKAITSRFTPKIETPYKGGVPGRQFTPGSSGGGGTATKTRTKVETAKPEVEAAPKAATKTEATTKPETAAKGKGKATTRTGTFAAGAAAAAAANLNKPKGDGQWTPSAIV